MASQLGRRPQGVVAVAARCRFGLPAVVATAPVVQGPDGAPTPFPTTLWLTCPYLVEAVSRLESAGWIGRLSREMIADSTTAEQLREAHEAAARLRQELLSPAMARALEAVSPRAVERLMRTGVAGARHRHSVKCLHAHLADYLGRGANPVGRRVAALLVGQGVGLSGHARCRSEDVPGCAAPSGLPGGRPDV